MSSTMKTWQILLLGIFFGLLAAGLILLLSAPPRGEPITLVQPENNASLFENQTEVVTQRLIKVHVAGEVNHPGVWDLDEGDRVNDAIAAAGGLTSTADIDRINLALKLTDGIRVYIPAIGESVSEQNSTTLLTLPVNDLVNINTASRDELATLPAIGLVKADSIITYRQTHGEFAEIEGIMDVAGIGSSIFEQIKNMITVNN